MDATVRFKSKPVEHQHFVDGRLVTGLGVRVPEIAYSHFTDPTCTMAKIGVKWANGDVRKRTGGWVMLDHDYPGITVDASGFLAVVTIDVTR